MAPLSWFVRHKASGNQSSLMFKIYLLTEIYLLQCKNETAVESDKGDAGGNCWTYTGLG